ncbi:MAG: 2-oxoglutarate dehydrogenase E1 component [Acidobacteria bacterium]|nr:2-oxoglutarate dehydrogenase E1 component [Acidobacteriota bacterium]
MGEVLTERDVIFDAFRRWGYLEAELDPLGYFLPQPQAELKLTGQAAAEARRIYCGTIGAEFMHIPEAERRGWLQERLESEPAAVDPPRILDRLLRAEVFEQVIQSRYVGTKRFSLEGNAALIPLLDEILNGAGERGAEQAVVAMSHRGRLNVMAHIVGRVADEIFAGFEDVDPRSVLGGGDVKYHMGATGVYATTCGRPVNIHLVSNPSHLEFVDPVALGRVRAKQTRLGENGPGRVLPVLLHGDAAFAGQGVAAEALNLAGVEGFSVGGTVHVIVNNLIGFTTGPKELHSSRFAADVAKRLPIPIFHVNAEDPEAVVRVGRLVVEYRYAFGSDVVVDLIGFRRYGHSEVDDPSITQPVLYRRIESHPPLYQAYAEKIGVDSTPSVEAFRAELDAAYQKAAGREKKPELYRLPAYWDNYQGGPYDPAYEVDTGLSAEELGEITAALVRYPEGFHIHPKVKRLLEQRAEMGRGKRPVDFGMAEALAFGSLLRQGIPVRLSGEDSQRGTFSQRHAVLVDSESEERYLPLGHLAPNQARFEIYNSVLSEAAVLGYEYGFSRDYPEALVLWEAQFGDFANVAQPIIDQFIAAGEDKWDLLAGVVLLLPHGHEGQGPEHSSARIERFLQIAAEDNLQVCQPSTAAQYFHLLRRQALRRWRKPLVVFTPKSMLRHPLAASKLGSFSRKRFFTVIPELEIENARRILVCSGKIGHELREERKRRGDERTAIVFLEQLYPFPDDELAAELDRHPEARDIVWVQEEPGNMGAFFWVVPHLERHARGRAVRSVKRSASASPATGSAKAHEVEQKTLLTLAFTTG